MALRREQLAAKATDLPALPAINREPVHPFCQCRPAADGSQWLSEDYWFCEMFGGVILAPIAVAHLKEMPITPDQHTLDSIVALDAKEEA